MTPVEQYKARGLREPIRIRPGFAYHFMLWGGGGFLLFGAMVAMAEGGPVEQLVGLFGFLFFGMACLILLVALVRAGRRGVFELSDQGLYMAHLGIVLPWSDIGPAWIQTVRTKGIALDDVTFVLRNASRHERRMGRLGRLLFAISRQVSRSRQGGLVDWGLRAVLMATEAGPGSHRQMDDILTRMRATVLEEPDSLVFNVPVTLRFGVSAHDLLAILNAEILARRGGPAGAGPADAA